MADNVIQFPPIRRPRKFDREYVRLFGGMTVAVVAATFAGPAMLFMVVGLLLVISAVVNLTYRDISKSEEK